MQAAFEEYREYGLACLPVKADKTPDVKGTWLGGVDRGYKNAFGIGIACGKASGNLECLDFDNHQGTAKANISTFMKLAGAELLLTVNKTRSNGYHVLYRCDRVEGNLKLAQTLLNGKPDTIIETRGEGGYFIAPPSPGYKTIRGDMGNIPTITVAERSRLLSIARSMNAYVSPERIPQEEGGRPGDLYNHTPEAIDDAKAALANAGWRHISGKLWRRPEKDEGISATFGYVAENIFYCFTSNGHPFEAEKAYTPFQVICLLEKNGDFKAFAKELSQKYSAVAPTQQQPAQEEKNILEQRLQEAIIDLSKPVSKPPTAIEIRKDFGTVIRYDRLFTLGNFSAITGKSKSKKTYLATLLMAAALNDEPSGLFNGTLPNGKGNVVFFDTEQSRYDSYMTSRRVLRIMGKSTENFATFDLRPYTPLERCELIGYALERFRGTIGLAVIDGIADLVNAINDEDEATRVVSLLMKWTAEHECHIITNIHQNKGNNYATGHIGSAVMKKAEAIISVTKDDQDASVSRVECDMIRGVSDFDDFLIKLDTEGMPSVAHI